MVRCTKCCLRTASHAMGLVVRVDHRRDGEAEEDDAAEGEARAVEGAQLARQDAPRATRADPGREAPKGPKFLRYPRLKLPTASVDAWD